MTDHLADARACIQAVAQAPHPDTRISWLTATCKQIIDHLEAQHAAQTAPQPEPGHGDQDESVQAAVDALNEMGDYLASSEDVARIALAAAEPHIRAKTLAPIRAALAHHPRCDIHPDDDPIKCGWKRAVADTQAALDGQEQP